MRSSGSVKISTHDVRLRKRMLETESPLDRRSHPDANFPRENQKLFLNVSYAYVKHVMAQRRPCNDVGSAEGVEGVEIRDVA